MKPSFIIVEDISSSRDSKTLRRDIVPPVRYLPWETRGQPEH
jgi:hypothetical protein